MGKDGESINHEEYKQGQILVPNREDSFEREARHLDLKDKESVRGSIEQENQKVVLSDRGREDEGGERNQDGSKKFDQSSVAQESRDYQHRQEEEEEQELFLESNISKTLTERTTKIVIILVLTLLFILPLFQDTTYFTTPTQEDWGLKYIRGIYDTGDWVAFNKSR